MDTLDYIAQKFQVDITQRPPIEILNINREIMAQTLNELGFKIGVEVGVGRGDHAELLCKSIPGVKLYCVDSWTRYEGYSEFFTYKLSLWHDQAIEKLTPYGCVIIQKFSMDAVKLFDTQSLDFVYIDGAHDFKNVANDICEWVKKVRHGGIIFGHDYKRSANPKLMHHVVDVVCGYTYAYHIRPWFILGEKGQADDKYKEGTRSWMWVC